MERLEKEMRRQRKKQVSLWKAFCSRPIIHLIIAGVIFLIIAMFFQNSIYWSIEKDAIIYAIILFLVVMLKQKSMEKEAPYIQQEDVKKPSLWRIFRRHIIINLFMSFGVYTIILAIFNNLHIEAIDHLIYSEELRRTTDAGIIIYLVFWFISLRIWLRIARNSFMYKVRSGKASMSDLYDMGIAGTIVTAGILGAAGSAASSNRRNQAMADDLVNSMMANSRAREEEANARAAEARRRADAEARERARYNDWAAKKEYDARDAALRGKTGAARNFKNEADYYKKMGRR